MAWYNDVINGAFAVGQSILQNTWGKRTARELSEHQFLLNEQSAENALKRRELWYQQHESPEAMVRQFRQAGLNPAAMLGGMTGSQGSSAPQGAGTSTNMAQVGNIADIFSNLKLAQAQAELVKAQKEKTDAEKEGIESDNYIKLLDQNIKQIEESIKSNEYKILYSHYKDDKSAYDLYNDSNSYEDWLNKLKENADNEDAKNAISYSGDALRKIYQDFTTTSRNINVLNAEKIDAKLKYEISEKLKESDYTNKSKTKILNELEQLIQQSNLDGRVKGVWNKFLDKLEDVGLDAATILILEVLEKSK